MDSKFNRKEAGKPNSTGHFYLFTTVYAEQILERLGTEASSLSAQNQLAALLNVSERG
jgi:hypothetical protein